MGGSILSSPSHTSRHLIFVTQMPTTMDTLLSSPTIILSLLLLFLTATVKCSTFTFTNNCGNTIWPGILSNAGSPQLESTGFELPAGASQSLQAPTGWSGRFWARTGCSFDASGRGSCRTGDCGSGEVPCNGAGAAPPATLAEFSLSGSGKDFYDVSLVDGYNVAMVVASSVAGCEATGCAVDLNRLCPAELRVGEGEACRSACEAFGKPEFCCSGEYASPATCRPSVYSEMFKSACPKSYSYAYDDPTSTFTCSGPSDYVVTFCPGSTPSSQKSSNDTPTTPQIAATGGSSANETPTTETTATDGAGAGVTQGSESEYENESWIASLAVSAAQRSRKLPLHQPGSVVVAYIACALLLV